MNYILLIAFIALCIWLYCKFNVKRISTGSLVMVTGGVKTGKTTMAVYLAIKNHKRAMLRYRILKLFKKDVEQPYLYSNIPIDYKYYKPLQKAHLLREMRFEYKSIIYISEASLIADSMYYKDLDVNERLLLFNKLIGHETHNGLLIYDTQSICDNHFAIKRCLNSYIYIQKSLKFIPFFVAMRVVELRYAEDGTTISVSDRDIDEITKWCLVPKSVWKRFDCFCYSIFTDAKPLSNVKVGKLSKSDLKAKRIISFKNYDTLKEFISNEEN